MGSDIPTPQTPEEWQKLLEEVRVIKSEHDKLLEATSVCQPNPLVKLFLWMGKFQAGISVIIVFGGMALWANTDHLRVAALERSQNAQDLAIKEISKATADISLTLSALKVLVENNAERMKELRDSANVFSMRQNEVIKWINNQSAKNP